ncbi:MAG: mycofactocin biosynthesis glycosyltransferase MftF, partial [Ilumatobacteraceae bacterium]
PNSTQESFRLAGLGNLHAARLLASTVTRSWWPIAVILALVFPRARRVLLAAALIPAMYEWWSQRPALNPLQYLALRLIDDASYGAGVWEGALAHRSIDALKPDVSSWPTHAQ